MIIDTLRADHVGAYGGRAYTPNIDSLAAQGVRYTRFFPEAMATVPARRSILTGRRVWPFRHWHRYPSLRNTPGWQPIDDPATTFTSALRRAGYWTGYITDNPFLGFSPYYEPFRDSFDRFVAHRGDPRPHRAGEQGHARSSSTTGSCRSCASRRSSSGSGATSRRAGTRTTRRRSWAARIFSHAADTLHHAAAHQPFALVADTFQPHEPWTPPHRYIDHYPTKGHRGPEPSTASTCEPPIGSQAPRRPGAPRGLATCTPPR